MLRSSQLLEDAFGRIQEVAHWAVDGLDTATLGWQIAPDANPIGWLVWHLTRIQDDHLSELAGGDQEWVTGRWAPRFGLDAATTELGLGHTAAQVRAVRPESPQVLLGYLDATVRRTRAFLPTITDPDLDRIVDTSWDPPVTMAVRLISVVDDNAQHAGQAAYLRGIHDRGR